MRYLVLLAIALLITPCHAAAPTELREWRAKSGHTVEAKALAISGGQVRLERPDGKIIMVALDKFADEDRQALVVHFSSPAPMEGEPADDLPHPLGKTTDEISCGDDFSYFLHLPESLLKGQEHPVLFVMSPGGGRPSVVKRYLPGATRNRWIIAVSKQSKNGFDGSADAINAMIRHVGDTLPIDQKRMYVSGFSGGSRMAFRTAQNHEKIAGVIACGAGGATGNSKQIVYGLCGSNCFNRTDMAHSFKGRIANKQSRLRYFPGKHNWAGAELCDDAITP